MLKELSSDEVISPDEGSACQSQEGWITVDVWCHPDLLFVTSPLICSGPPVLVEEDSEQKSSLEWASNEGAASLGEAHCERLLMGSMWGAYSCLTPSP